MLRSTSLHDEDLNAYFRRIELDGGRTPALAALRAIVYGHATTIPFENLLPGGDFLADAASAASARSPSIATLSVRPS